MSEQNLLNMSNTQDLGKVEIAPEVIEVIAGLAASEVEGVASMRGNFAADVIERLGKKSHGKGVKVELSENGITIDVFAVMKFDVNIPEVARQIQENIRQTLLNMTALEVEEINIHVVGVQLESKKLAEDVTE
ncbi:Asp23/Gls24 family envelope stress response protein [Bacillus marinisedimentorum]|uniref:Asp23/Gls24 family envelope stress response protein n=1 Tax=Bacillus marinisedimentorum TaxID=1821260 RepID=UPI000872ACA6|nr:Asp23/Gls24 family envelope stress response protein [Bacillus marinisedimentorum]